MMQLLISMAFALAMATSAAAQTANPPSPPSTPTTSAAQPPAEVRQMLELMQTPQVKEWMATQMKAAPTATLTEAGEMSALSELVGHARRHVEMVSGAAMEFPGEVETASEVVEREVAPTG